MSNKALMRILHSSDQHLRDKSITEAEKCCDFIIDTATKEKPDLIASCGDLFDSQEVRIDSQAARLGIRFISRLADIAPVAIITGTYRHEGNAPEILRYARGKFPVHVASYPGQIFLYQGMFYETMGSSNLQPDAIITMIPTVTKQFFKTASGIADADQEIAQAMTALFTGFGASAAPYKAPHILMWHGGISGARIPSGHVLTGQDIEISTDQIRLAGGNHDFLGCFYPGPIYPVKVDEQECGFWVHELDERDFIGCLGHIHQPQHIGGGESGTGMSYYKATPITKTMRFKEDFTKGDGTREEFDMVLYSHVPEDDKGSGSFAGAAVRLELTVWQDESGEIDREKLKNFYLSAGAGEVEINITRIPRVQVRSESVLAAESLGDKLVASARLRGEEVTPEALLMAGLLEHTPGEELLKMVMEGAI